jgi:hypothetical protein
VKNRETFKEIFGLVIRLLGVYFLWAGLAGLNVPALTNVQMIQSDQWTDIVSALLPAAFNLVVAWWLIGGSLVRRAYPREWSASAPAYVSSRPDKTSEEEAKVSEAPAPTGMDQADQKLASLVTDKK